MEVTDNRVINEKPNIMDVFNSMKFSSNEPSNRRLSSSKLKRLSYNLFWRQSHQNKAECIIPFQNGDLKFYQIPNGERKEFGTGAHVWPAAIILAKYLEKPQSHPFVQDKDCIDLGSGTGIIGIVAALLNAKNSVITDIKELIPLMEKNRSNICNRYSDDRNDIRIKDSVHICAFDWSDQNITFPLREFDTVFVSDCILPQLYPIEPLVMAIAKFMKEDGIALISYEARTYPYYDPLLKFKELCVKHGLEIFKNVPLEEMDPVYVSDEVQLLHIKRINKK